MISQFLALTASPDLADDAVRRRRALSRISLDLVVHWMDILGFLAEGDLDSAEMLSSEILLTALDAACIQDGDLCEGRRIWSRACRSKSLASARQWVRNLLMPHLGMGPHGKRLCMDRMLAAQKVVSLALLREWNPDCFVPTPAAAPGGSGNLMRSPYWLAFRVAESAILSYRGTRQYPLPDLALACWFAADGCSQEEIEEVVALVYPDSAAHIKKTIDELRGIGAIANRSDWKELCRPYE